MSADNLVVLRGRINYVATKKVGETDLTEFSVSVYNWRKKSEKKNDYYKAQLWGGLSERFVKSGAKDGDTVGIVGELETNEWEKDGKVTKVVQIRANDFSYDSRQKNEVAPASAAAPAQDELPPF